MNFIIFFSLVFITTFALWKYVRLKHDVYEYTEKLDNTINYMLKNGELKTTPYENDDLWEKIYEKLVRLSHLYTHKNLEISEEKDKLKELVSDISHQTKTSIANIKLYLEIMTDESDFKKNQEYMRKMNGQIDKLDFLLQSMVKMSRLETGTIKIQKQNKKQYKKKLKNSAFDLLTDIHFFNLLVSNGLDLTTKDRDGQSYLETAAKKGRTDMINSFVQVGMPYSEEDIRHAKQAARFNNYPSAEKYLGALESLRCQSEKKNLKQGGILPKIAVLGTILNNEAPRFEMLQKQIIRLSALDKVQNMYQ